MFTLIRLALMLLFRFRWGPFILAAIIIVVGLCVGLTSHQVAYQQAKQVTINHYISGDDGDAYIQTSDGSLYTLNETDFTPALSSDALQSSTATFVYDPQDTQSINVSADNTGTHLEGKGATVVELISYGDDGAAPTTFASTEFTEHPQGFYKNQWGEGALIALAGVAIGAISFFVRKNRKNQPGYNNAASRNSFSITPASAMAAGHQQQAPLQQQEANTPNPYQQPYTQPPDPYKQPDPYQPPDPYKQPDPYAQQPYPPAPGQQPAKPDRYTTLPGALPSNPSWTAPTEYNPYNNNNWQQ